MAPTLLPLALAFILFYLGLTLVLADFCRVAQRSGPKRCWWGWQARSGYLGLLLHNSHSPNCNRRFSHSAQNSGA